MPEDGSKESIVVAGASGVIGKYFIPLAREEGHSVRVLTRGDYWASFGVTRYVWDPAKAATGDKAALEDVRAALDGADWVLNLAGTSLAKGRLDTDHKKRVLDSRVDSTRALVQAHALCAKAPSVWLNASAAGFYGDTGEADVTEATPNGAGFLAAVCKRWEEATQELPDSVRVVLPRIGLVLAREAEAWQKLLKPILWGVGGPLGDGQQWWSWIDAVDVARAFLFLFENTDARGPVNVTSPDPVRQGDLARQTALLTSRPAMLSAPAFLLRLAIGEVADALLLPSCRALPERLTQLGFTFKQPRLGRELLALLDLEGVSA